MSQVSVGAADLNMIRMSCLICPCLNIHSNFDASGDVCYSELVSVLCSCCLRLEYSKLLVSVLAILSIHCYAPVILCAKIIL